MNNTMEYKGYIGTVEFSEEDCLLYGIVRCQDERKPLWGFFLYVVKIFESNSFP